MSRGKVSHGEKCPGTVCAHAAPYAKDDACIPYFLLTQNNTSNKTKSKKKKTKNKKQKNTKVLKSGEN